VPTLAADSASISSSRGEAAEPSWWFADPRSFEDGEGWKLDVVVDLTRRPPKGKVPFRFELDMRVLYQRARDGVYQALPLTVPEELTITRNVCFQAVRGQRFKLALPLERQDGFHAGEYRMRLVRADTGERIGGSHKLVLHDR
jgi:hypothetical protein